MIETLGEANWEHFRTKLDLEEFSQAEQADIDKNLVQYIEDNLDSVLDESQAYFPNDELIQPHIFPWVGKCHDVEEDSAAECDPD